MRTLEDAVREFIALFEVVEESDSGRAFHPTTINSCRALDAARIAELIGEMKDFTRERHGSSLRT